MSALPEERGARKERELAEDEDRMAIAAGDDDDLEMDCGPAFIP